MENDALFHKNVKIKIADELLKEKSPFEKISNLTGWTPDEIWLYIDMEYRKKYPKQCESDIEYYCRGENIENNEKVR